MLLLLILVALFVLFVLLEFHLQIVDQPAASFFSRESFVSVGN